MPADALKGLADKHNISISMLEKWWRECKAGAQKKDGVEDINKYAMGCVMNRVRAVKAAKGKGDGR